MSQAEPMPIGRSAWHVFQRVQEVEAALRINIVRLLSIAGFYAAHFFSYMQVQQPLDAERRFHWQATWIALTWLFVVAIVFVALKVRVLPPIAKYLTTSCDVLLLTSVAAMGARAHSPLVLIFLLIIAATYLQFDLRLVLLATLLSLGGYLALVGLSDSAWFDANHEVPIAQQLISLVSLGIAGLIGWQICNSSRRWFREHRRPDVVTPE